MLVLSRRLGEVLTIHLPEGIVSVVVLGAFDGVSARLGIQAAQEILILKEELRGKTLTFRSKGRSQNSQERS